MSAVRLLVSAGPSREWIDDVRYLSNASTGRMGIEVAACGLERGFDVQLLIGSLAMEVPDGIPHTRFESAQDLDRLTREHWGWCDAFVATAAVCDYRPRERVPGKFKKGDGDWNLQLVRNPDVLANRGAEKGSRILVGFALEATMNVDEARRKLVQKNLDLIILNTAANLGSRGGDFAWIDSIDPHAVDSDAGGVGSGETGTTSSLSKRDLADKIVEYVEARCR